MCSLVKLSAAVGLCTAALSVSFAPCALADGNSVSSYAASSFDGSSATQLALEVAQQLSLFYRTTAENYKAAGLQIPDEILEGLNTYGNVDISSFVDAASDAFSSYMASDGQMASDKAGETVTWMEQEDGTSLLYRVDASTGDAVLYEGWYSDASGEKCYYEKGKAVSGWIIDEGKFYYLNPATGTMAVSQQVGNFYVGEDGAALIDTTAPDGTRLAYNGSRMISKSPVEKLDSKVYLYRELLVEDPDLYAEFTARSSGSYQIMPESANGFAWYTYASMKLYKRNEDGSVGEKVYEGDGCFSRSAAIEYENGDGTISTMRPSDIVGSGHEMWKADHIHIDPAGFITYSAILK